MTLRTRNRFIRILFAVSTLFFFTNQIILLLGIINHSFTFQYFDQYLNDKFFLFRYSPYYVLSSNIFLNFYVSSASIILYRSFEKTAAIEAVYAILYLIACLASCARLIIFFFNLPGTYTYLLTACGSTVLFSKLLFPISILFLAAMPFIDQIQDTNRNVFLIIILCIFFAEIIPINTSITKADFSVFHSYEVLIHIFSTVCIISGIVITFIRNNKRMNNQKTTIGYSCTSIGLLIIFSTTTLFQLITGIVLITLGTYFYYYELHKQYLWND